MVDHGDRPDAWHVRRIVRQCGLPDKGQRHAFYKALIAPKDVVLARIGARVFEALMIRFGERQVVPDDLHWRRARLLHAAGRAVEAVAASDVLHARSVMDAGARRHLATTRVGALLDIYDVNGDANCLVQADRSLSIAKGHGPEGVEIRSLCRRLNDLFRSGGAVGVNRGGLPSANYQLS